MTGLVKIFSQLNFVQFLGLFVCVGTGIYWASLKIIFSILCYYWFACFSRSFIGWAGLNILFYVVFYVINVVILCLN